MSLFLTILKIIGIVLLLILGVLLLILLLVLFVPIRYKVNASVKETDLQTEKDKLKENVSADVKFSWLLHLVRGGISYPDDLEFKVKVLCFTVFPPKKKLSEENVSDDEALETEKESGFEDSTVTSDVKKEEVSEESSFEEQSSENPKKDYDNHYNNENSKADNFETDDFDNEDKGFLNFLKKILDTVIKIVKVPQDVFLKIQYTTSRICDKINMVKNTLSNDIFKRAFEVTKKQLIKVLKMIIPKRFKAEFLIGLEDPTVTADILSAYGVLYPLLVNKVYVVPDFERQILKGDIHFKGRITVFRIIWAAAILYFNKDVKKTYRRFKRIINS
ncbi:DUF2953 domain-containing protein [Butyrivibrio sp. INlla16]|uniref:DUF2953 domain-containing protein n=1 Tax=Butyrivibrio sp. INlla16 TaxID=1520807 RepID=UPI00087F976B|nr:DUF2953 domain-containing protein [Butyrivibrio sp. INlla16]SDB16694.1 hypothetical protein SAMN02910263_00771 [Butyrivibrio sp. INlla16]